MIPVNPDPRDWHELRQSLQAMLFHLTQVHETRGTLTIADPPEAQTFSGSGTKLNAFTESSGTGVTASHANDKITILHAGLYLVAFHVSLEAASGSSEVLFAARANNDTELCSNYATVGTDIVATAAIGEAELDVGDEIEIYESGGQNVEYTIHRLRLTVKRVG